MPPAAKPITSNRPSVSSARIASSNASPPMGSTTRSTPRPSVCVLHRLQPAVGQRQHDIGAQRLHELDGLRAVHHGDHLGAQRLCDLHRRRADAAGRSQHQHRLARPQGAAAGQREVHRLVVAQQRNGFGVVEVIGCRRQVGGRHRHLFGPAAEHRQRRNPLARRESGLVRCRPHHPGDLHAGDERRLEPQLVLTAQEQQVGKADPGRTDVDDDRVVTADIVDVGVVQPRRTGKLPRDKRFHASTISRR